MFFPNINYIVNFWGLLYFLFIKTKVCNIKYKGNYIFSMNVTLEITIIIIFIFSKNKLSINNIN